MGIFDSIKNAILGTHPHSVGAAVTSQPQASPTASPPRAAATSGSPSPQPSGTQAPSQASAAEPVDIEAVLNERATQKHERLNWQTSIVDLMKLVDLDPSFENRKTLAKELGYTGNPQDSASMNIWLHKEVMQKLAASGGKVPDSLRH